MDAIELQKRIQQMTAGGAGAQQMADFAEDLVAQAHESARRSARVAMGLASMVFVVIAGAAGLGALGAALRTPGSPPDLGSAAGLGVAAVLTALVGAMFVRNTRALGPPPRELVAAGVPARLTVRDYRRAPGGFGLRTNSSRVDFERVAIDLDVVTAEGAAYATTVREYLVGRAFVQLAVGATLVGYVDRTNPQRIFIDWRARRGSGA